MSNAIATTQPTELASIQETVAGVVESVLISGDLSKLNPKQRVDYYQNLCKSLNLNPLTRPFDYVTLKGKLTLYAKKDATDQIRRTLEISQKFLGKRFDKDTGIYEVEVESRLPSGRSDVAAAFLYIGSSKGEELANALMKCETKAKRRGTLAIAGLGFMDETEVSDVKDARFVDPDSIEDEMLRLESIKQDEKKTVDIPKEEQKPKSPKKEPVAKAVETAPAEDVSEKSPTKEQLNLLSAGAYRAHLWQPSQIKEIIQLTFGKAGGIELNMSEYTKLSEIVSKFDYATAKRNIQEHHAKKLQDAVIEKEPIDVGF